jgi:hypothetical protein
MNPIHRRVRAGAALTDDCIEPASITDHLVMLSLQPLPEQAVTHVRTCVVQLHSPSTHRPLE